MPESSFLTITHKANDASPLFTKKRPKLRHPKIIIIYWVPVLMNNYKSKVKLKFHLIWFSKNALFKVLTILSRIISLNAMRPMSTVVKMRTSMSESSASASPWLAALFEAWLGTSLLASSITWIGELAVLNHLKDLAEFF